MIVWMIALIIGSPVAFLMVGFLGVSRKRAEEGREMVDLSVSQAVANRSDSTFQAAKKAPQPTLRPSDPSLDLG